MHELFSAVFRLFHVLACMIIGDERTNKVNVSTYLSPNFKDILEGHTGVCELAL